MFYFVGKFRLSVTFVARKSTFHRRIRILRMVFVGTEVRVSGGWT